MCDQVYVEIIVGSNAMKFTGSGTSMRKAKQTAARLALNEVGFKQFKTKQSRVEVGEGSSKAKVVEQIIARSQGEQGRTEQSRYQGKSISKGKVEELGSGHSYEEHVMVIADVEKRGRSKKVSEQQHLGRKHEQDQASRKPFPQHNMNCDATPRSGDFQKGLISEKRFTKNTHNKSPSTFDFEARPGDTDEGSFEDTDGGSGGEMGESNMDFLVEQHDAELCNSYRIGETQATGRTTLQKKKYSYS